MSATSDAIRSWWERYWGTGYNLGQDGAPLGKRLGYGHDLALEGVEVTGKVVGDVVDSAGKVVGVIVEKAAPKPPDPTSLLPRWLLPVVAIGVVATGVVVAWPYIGPAMAAGLAARRGR